MQSLVKVYPIAIKTTPMILKVYCLTSISETVLCLSVFLEYSQSFKPTLFLGQVYQSSSLRSLSETVLRLFVLSLSIKQLIVQNSFINTEH